MRVGRHHAAFLVQIAPLLRKRDRDSAREHHVGLAQHQRLTCLGDGKQRRRACRLQRHGRPAQIELVRTPCRQEVVAGTEQLGVASDLVVAGKALDGVPAPEHVAKEVRAETAARENADRSRERRRIVTCVFQGLPAALEKETMLRIRQLRLARMHPEERGVEVRDPAQDRASLYIVRPRPHAGRECVFEFRVRKRSDAFDPGAQILPKGRNVASAGKTAGAPDDGDRALAGASFAWHRAHDGNTVLRARSVRASSMVRAMPVKTSQPSMR